MKKCPICQSDLEKYINEKNFSVEKCSNCGLGVTVNPNIQTSDYHRDEEYISEEKLFKNIFQKRVNIISRFKKPGKALEVGCANGLMLSLLKEKGWEVTGVEISSKSAEAARGRGVNIIQGDFLKTQLKHHYDLIIFNHTLEHLEKPHKIIQKAVELLNKKGLLYLDQPNFGGLAAKFQKGNWPSLLPKEHLWQFTQKSLEILLREFNMKIIYSNKSSGIWDYAQPLTGILISIFSFKKRFLKEIITALPSLIVSKFGMGSDLMIISRKQ